MAKLAIVDGVKLSMYANDHPPPHFHALVAEHHAVIDLEELATIRGHPPRIKVEGCFGLGQAKTPPASRGLGLTQAHLPTGRIV